MNPVTTVGSKLASKALQNKDFMDAVKEFMLHNPILFAIMIMTFFIAISSCIISKYYFDYLVKRKELETKEKVNCADCIYEKFDVKALRKLALTTKKTLSILKEVAKNVKGSKAIEDQIVQLTRSLEGFINVFINKV